MAQGNQGSPTSVILRGRAPGYGATRVTLEFSRGAAWLTAVSGTLLHVLAVANPIVHHRYPNGRDPTEVGRSIGRSRSGFPSASR